LAGLQLDDIILSVTSRRSECGLQPDRIALLHADRRGMRAEAAVDKNQQQHKPHQSQAAP
jgi:hypothetical protein